MNKKTGETKRKAGQEGSGAPRWVIAVGALVLLGMVTTLMIGFKGGGDSDRSEMSEGASPGGPPSAAPAGLKAPEGVEFFENEGQNHVREGVRVPYKTDPPTSGSHYDRWAPPSVYGAGEVPPELLVHNLEHGNVVIYFDRSALAPNEIDELTELSKKYIGQWDGVLLVGRDDKAHPVTLTAWRAMLRLKQYKKEKVSEFLDAFRGRGPEKPVR